jgi:glycosyltransferase involved in cell wall biosynthesis
MNILFLTQYFPPESGAPQNRISDLARRMQSAGASVSVLTAMPNYPRYEIFDEYRGRLFVREPFNGTGTIYRSWIFVTKRKNLVFRMLNYLSFTISSLIVGCFVARRTDVIVCESPPLFLGFTAVVLKWLTGASLVFNVSDLWPESAVKLGLVTNPVFIRLSRWLEEWIYRNAEMISGQTKGIVQNIRSRFPEKPVQWLRNGVDADELRSRLSGRNWREEKGFSRDDVIFYFGGLLGYAQGVDCILRAAELVRDEPKAKFVIYGDGPEKERLMQLKSALALRKVFLYDGVSRSAIADVIHNVDVGIIPLKKLELFRGAIPSKIFEILSLGKPVLLGVEGEAKDMFIDEAKAGLAFEPDNPQALAECVRFVLAHREKIQEWGCNGEAFVKAHFDRAEIAAEFLKFISRTNGNRVEEYATI